MSKRFIVYRHTTPSGKCYVGITTTSVRERIRSGYLHNRYMKSAIEKYGWDNIRTEILAENVTQEEASLLETFLIESFETKVLNWCFDKNDKRKIKRLKKYHKV